MRISDWSSDVCSSDLFGACGLDRSPMNVAIARVDRHPLRRIEGAIGRPARRPPQRKARGKEQQHDGAADPTQSAQGRGAPRGQSSAHLSARKSVLSGKSATVRVDLGERSLITTNHITTPPTIQKTLQNT